MSLREITLLLQHPTDNRLSDVVSQMQTLGPPTVVIYFVSEEYGVALEGAHRLTAAELLGIPPTLVSLNSRNDDDALEQYISTGLDVTVSIKDTVYSILKSHQHNETSPSVTFTDYKLVPPT